MWRDAACVEPGARRRRATCVLADHVAHVWELGDSHPAGVAGAADPGRARRLRASEKREEPVVAPGAGVLVVERAGVVLPVLGRTAACMPSAKQRAVRLVALRPWPTSRTSGRRRKPQASLEVAAPQTVVEASPSPASCPPGRRRSNRKRCAHVEGQSPGVTDVQKRRRQSVTPLTFPNELPLLEVAYPIRVWKLPLASRCFRRSRACSSPGPAGVLAGPSVLKVRIVEVETLPDGLTAGLAAAPVDAIGRV